MGELEERLPDTERVNPASRDLDRLSAIQIVRLMNDEDAGVATAVRAELPRIAAAVEAIADRMAVGGRLIYVGAGTSGRLGVLDAAECPPTFGTTRGQVIGVIAGGAVAVTQAVEQVEDNADLGRADVTALKVSAIDAVVGLAASGRTPYVLGAMAAARERGALTVGLACTHGSPLSQAVDIMIAPLVGPEVLAGSTRLKAGTAQKMVLNMLSTGSMVLLGKTFGNLMVDMRATNSKLRNRAVRIVAEVTHRSSEEAARFLAAAQGEVKTAIVCALLDVSPAEARERLAGSGGRVRDALGEREP